MDRDRGRPRNRIGTQTLAAALGVILLVIAGMPVGQARPDEGVHRLRDGICMDRRDSDVGVGVVAYITLCATQVSGGCRVEFEAGVIGASPASEYRATIGSRATDGDENIRWRYWGVGPVLWPRTWIDILPRGEHVRGWAGIEDLTLGDNARAQVDYTC